MKSQKYQDLEEQYVNGEISEGELERRMEELFESGDDFLEYEEEGEPVVDRDEARFRLREAAQIVGAAILIPTVLYFIFITSGVGLILLVPVIVTIAIYKMGFFR